MVFYNNINPVLVSLGPFDIRYYGLFYGIGFLMSYFIVRYLIKKNKKTNLKPNDVDDFYIYIMVSGLLGGRLFYCFFYNFNYYIHNILDIVKVWNGGMAFHGGLLGAILGILLYVYQFNKKKETKKEKIHFYDIADMMVIPFALSLALGRIGNFTNHELYGRLTDLPWGTKFKTVSGFRHPSQLYESAKNILIFISLWNINKIKDIQKGVLFWSFTALYGILRFFIEFVREPSDKQLGEAGVFLGWMTPGQFLCILMIISGVGMISYIYWNRYKKLSKKYD